MHHPQREPVAHSGAVLAQGSERRMFCRGGTHITKPEPETEMGIRAAYPHSFVGRGGMTQKGHPKRLLSRRKH
jgi:hypothetical protein